ncbi:unnamed protein product [Phytophthora lilii]|uniref:Unnamed protein product n=1 Tax=Phytophthora lilii TaxID=2077276 RepID=A0A9W6WVB7_9STRA|nr:unnamed protein product [Phytophthora lilii]
MWSFLSGSSDSVLLGTPEFPLRVLQEAITTRDESKVWKVLRRSRIRNELITSTTTHKVPSDPEQQKYNVFTCVEAAIHCNLPRVVLAMYRYNPVDVRLATWFALYRLRSESKTDHFHVKVSPEVADLARAQCRLWLWDQFGVFVLLRQWKPRQNRASRRQERQVYAVQLLASIPDEALKIIVSFIDLHEDREARILKFLIEARPCPTCSRLSKGASLRTKDDHRCTVLMSACAAGAHPNVIKCLLDWDKTNSKHPVLRWKDQDDDGRTALGLASSNGHGRLASFVLDVLEPEEEIGCNTPLHALNSAIKSGNERCVLELLRNRKLMWVIKENRKEDKLTVLGEWNQTCSQRLKTDEEDVTVSSCVAAAVKLDMVRVVEEMHRLNRRMVGHATWFALCSEDDMCTQKSVEAIQRVVRSRPEFVEIADLHRRDSASRAAEYCGRIARLPVSASSRVFEATV